MKKYWWILVIIIVVALGVTAFFIFNKKTSANVTIKGKEFNVALALTDAQREKGLSKKESLDDNSGMLFVFPKSEIHSFWMKDTLIPLDIIWLAPSEVEGMSKIVEMATLDPQSEEMTPQYTPKNKANYVLELNAGEITENDFNIGDEVKINL